MRDPVNSKSAEFQKKLDTTGNGNALRLYQVDAFASKPFQGNPAAVILLDRELDDETLQAIAAENNLAETAFLACVHDDPSVVEDPFQSASEFSIRWFTPECEVPLCGHATLAAASVIFSECGNLSSTIEFHTCDSGSLYVSRASNIYCMTPSMKAAQEAGLNRLVMEMSLPLADPLDDVPKGCADPVLLATCVGSAKVKEVRYTATALKYLLVVLDDSTTKEQLQAIQPDMIAMKRAFARKDVHAVVVTAHGGENCGYDFLSRFFAPWMGIDEDHVTGSAHALLAPYWQARLGRDTMTACQCSKRSGELIVKVDRGSSRALIFGSAVTVIKGHCYL